MTDEDQIIGSNTHLAVSYTSLTTAENTGEVLNSLKKASGEIGVMSDSVEAYAINDLGEKHDVHIDFYSVSQSKLKGLERAKKDDHPPETKYVFSGTGKRDQVIADKAGWDYVEFDELMELIETEG